MKKTCDTWGRFSAPFAVILSYGNKQWLVYSEPLPFRSFRVACAYAWLRCHVFRRFRGYEVFRAEVLEMQSDSPFAVRFPLRSFSFYEKSLLQVGEHTDRSFAHLFAFCVVVFAVLLGLASSC